MAASFRSIIFALMHRKYIARNLLLVNIFILNVNKHCRIEKKKKTFRRAIKKAFNGKILIWFILFHLAGKKKLTETYHPILLFTKSVPRSLDLAEEKSWTFWIFEIREAILYRLVMKLFFRIKKLRFCVSYQPERFSFEDWN